MIFKARAWQWGPVLTAQTKTLQSWPGQDSTQLLVCHDKWDLCHTPEESQDCSQRGDILCCPLLDWQLS